jgi:hypothetical protein
MPRLNLASLATIATIVGGYFVQFQTKVAAYEKTGIGAAVVALVATYVHEHHATVRAETTAAASLGQAPAARPSHADVAAIAGKVMADMGVAGPRPTAGPSTS